ncbi:hypothetical protein BN2475_1030011 [Paraburkholderia ribeironis]|uniref:Uncharacterized protein n=1 Tax=Paraburkholderia ribeironis TaxID=1247936 RepID=A0A1N7SM05_9BURK|nr:hypothetical protein BN2475_1030011 [Paraburkholderia ribeironis]
MQLVFPRASLETVPPVETSPSCINRIRLTNEIYYVSKKEILSFIALDSLPAPPALMSRLPR